jgi:NAD(P)-dependent dehydrogenase (short-subunit alcohol dehydrogenase family)
MNVNLFGVVNGLNTSVPVLQSQNQQAAIVVTGSKQGITNPPGNAAYNASKSAVKTLTKHLAYDLKGSPISVHLLVPGFTFTGLVRDMTIRSVNFARDADILPRSLEMSQEPPSRSLPEHGGRLRLPTISSRRGRRVSSISCVPTTR